MIHFASSAHLLLLSSRYRTFRVESTLLMQLRGDNCRMHGMELRLGSIVRLLTVLCHGMIEDIAFFLSLSALERIKDR